MELIYIFSNQLHKDKDGKIYFERKLNCVLEQIDSF